MCAYILGTYSRVDLETAAKSRTTATLRAAAVAATSTTKSSLGHSSRAWISPPSPFPLYCTRCRTETQLGSCWSVGQPSCLRCETALKHELSCYCCCCCCCSCGRLCALVNKNIAAVTQIFYEQNNSCSTSSSTAAQQQQQHAQQQQLPQRCIFYCCCVGNVTAGGHCWQQQQGGLWAVGNGRGTGTQK